MRSAKYHWQRCGLRPACPCSSIAAIPRRVHRHPSSETESNLQSSILTTLSFPASQVASHQGLAILSPINSTVHPVVRCCPVCLLIKKLGQRSLSFQVWNKSHLWKFWYVLLILCYENAIPLLLWNLGQLIKFKTSTIRCPPFLLEMRTFTEATNLSPGLIIVPIPGHHLDAVTGRDHPLCFKGQVGGAVTEDFLASGHVKPSHFREAGV